MHFDQPHLPNAPLRPSSFDGVLGRKIIALHVWAVGQGLRGVTGRRSVRRVFAGAWSRPACRCGGLLPGCAPCIRNGAAMAIPGGAISTLFGPNNTSAATNYEQSYMRQPVRLAGRQRQSSSGQVADRWPQLRRRLCGPRGTSRFSGPRGVSPPPAAPIILPRWSRSARGATPRAEPASASPLPPTAPRASPTTTSCCCERCCRRCRSR